MSLKELSSRSAVLNAMKEFDALGQATFLKHHGFGKARDYAVIHRGRSYDSKAIAGVAYGYQFPSRGPLKASEFSGGVKTVVAKLKELGFQIGKATD